MCGRKFSGSADLEFHLSTSLPHASAPTARRSSAPDGYRGLVERLVQGVSVVRVVHDEAGDAIDIEYVEVNASIRSRWGDVTGRRASEVLPAMAGPWVTAVAAVAASRAPTRLEMHEPALGRWYDVQFLPFDDDEPALVALVIDDVTARKEAEAELRTNAERMRLSQDAGQVGVFEWDVERDATWWSPAQWRLFGHEPGLASADPAQLFRAAIHPDDGAVLDRAVQRCLAGELPTIRLEMRIVRPDGTIRWIDVVAAVTARTADGRPRRLAGVNIDVTDRVLVEQALRETEERFRIMADGLPHIVWVHDETGVLRFVNQTYLDFFGITHRQLMVEGWMPLTHPDDGQAYAEEFAACVAERRPFNARVRVRHVSGEWRVVESWGRPRFAPDGTYLGHVGTSADVTEAQRAAEERDSLARQRRIALDAARLGWWRFGPTMADFAGDERLGEIFGVEGAGRPLDDFLARIHPEDRPAVIAAIEAAIDPARALPYEITYRVLHPARGLRWIEALGRATFEGEGAARHVVEFVGTVADITERKAADEALREADRRKDEFMAMLAHELRNPLAPVRHAVELMRRAGGGDALVERAREIIGRQVSHMARLIDDLLDVSRIARGRVQLRLEPLDLLEVVRQTAESYRPALADAGLALDVVLPTAPVPVLGDATRLSQVIGNLLHNAGKFTARGGRVVVSLACEGREAVIAVTDTGIGIEPALLATLFSPFAQGEQALDRAHGGLGLGLALVKGLTEMHAGRVAAHSEGAGTGARFSVRLPMIPAAALHDRVIAEPGAPPPLRVLVVEDNADAADMLQAILALSGHTVRVAFDGASGVATARDWRPDAIVCDIGLPGALDGLGVARAVRADPALAGTWLVALSGYGQAHDIERTRAAGFDRHLVKPAEYERLAAALVRDGEGALSTPASRGT